MPSQRTIMGLGTVFLTLAGCKGDEKDSSAPTETGDTATVTDTADSGTTEDTADSAAEPACAVTRFAPVGEGYGLPNGYDDDTFVAAHGVEGRDTAWRLVHVDGRPAILTLRATGLEDVGVTRWLLHRAGATGFDAAATDWSLPTGLPGGGDAGFDAHDASLHAWPAGLEPAYESVDAHGEVVAGRPWLHDLDADGWPDVVAFTATGWSVFRGGASGLATEAVTWALPDGAPAAALDGRADTTPDDGLNWRIVDMDGDGREDLVVQASPTDATIGATRWVVYRNTGVGFAAGADWLLPPVDAGTPAGGGRFLADLDGDGRPELVVPRAAREVGGGLGDTEPDGTPRWTVFPNQGTGFGGAVVWALPEGYPIGTFAHPPAYGTSEVHWALRDLTGDGVADLVIVADTREGADTGGLVGTARWRVHAGSNGIGDVKAGWGRMASDFVLPTSLPEGALAMPDDLDDRDPAWALIDLDGDQRLDLVATSWSSGTEEGIGSTRWLVWKGQCEATSGD